MRDLEYEGKDPKWFKLDFLEQLNQIKGTDPLNGGNRNKAKDVERLMDEKAKLATELAKV